MPRPSSSIALVPLALALAACSDPPPTPAAMGLSISLGPPSAEEVPDVGIRNCSAGTTGGYTYLIGQPAPGKTIEDGKNQVEVSCLVQQLGSKYKFSADGRGVDSHSMKIVSFSISGTINDVGNPTANPGLLAFYSPDTAQLSTDTSKFPGCTIGPVSTAKKGALLTDFTCPIISAADDTTSGCKAHGTIALEFCRTGEEED